MGHLIKKSAHAIAATIAIDLKKYRAKAGEFELAPRMLSAATIIFSILFIVVFGTNVLAGTELLIIINAIDIWAMFLKKESKTKVYADRISEAIMFSIMPFPWEGLLAINFILTILRIESRKKIPIIPLKLIFLIFIIFGAL